jgi:hypothetical protein
MEELIDSARGTRAGYTLATGGAKERGRGAPLSCGWVSG